MLKPWFLNCNIYIFSCLRKTMKFKFPCLKYSSHYFYWDKIHIRFTILKCTTQVTFSIFQCYATTIIFQNIFIPLAKKKKTILIKQSFCIHSSLQPWWSLICFLSLWICLFWIFHTNGIIHVTFCAWLPLLNNTLKVHSYSSIYQYLISFYDWIKFHCVDIPHLFNPFIGSLTLTTFWLW